jgi:signal transduction histidine kinase
LCGTSRNPPILWSAVIVAITVVIVGTVWWHFNTYRKNDHLVVLSRDVQRSLYEFTVCLQDVENGARGFVLTAQPRFRTIFQSSANKLANLLDAAEKAAATIGMQEAFRGLKELTASRTQILREAVALTEAGRAADAAELFQSESTLQQAATMRQRMLELLGTTDATLQTRLANCRSSMRSMSSWVMAGLASLMLASLALAWVLWRDVRRARATNAELAYAKDAALAGVRSRDEFLDVLSHELRTPLTPALLAVTNLERRAEPGSEQQQDLTMVRRQLELEARMIDDLLDVNRILRGEVLLGTTRVSIHALIRHLVETFAHEIEAHPIELTCSLNASSDEVMGSESRLHVVFWHLLSNAIKFTPEGGSVTVSSTSDTATISIVIADTGVGLTPVQLSTIFDLFWQGESSRKRRFGGLGVGLSIVRSVVELHRGTVRADSAGKDRGTTMTVTLPLATSASGRPVVAQVAPSGRLDTGARRD